MLSARFDTTVSAFVKANNISNADLIYTRHELIVPASDELLAYAKSKLS
jgi:LysM repeat protein